MREQKEKFFNNILDIAIKYTELLNEKLADKNNHSGKVFLEEINDGIRILNQLTGMIDRGNFVKSSSTH